MQNGVLNHSNLPTYQPTNIPTYQPTNIPTYQPTNLPTYQPTNIPTYRLTNLPTYQHTNLPPFCIHKRISCVYTIDLLCMHNTLVHALGQGPQGPGTQKRRWAGPGPWTAPFLGPWPLGSLAHSCPLHTSPSPRDRTRSRMPSSA